MRRLFLILSLTLFWPAVAAAQVGEALIVFKDGFSIKGKVVQKRAFITDPVSGQSFVIPKDGSLIHLDDGVRRIHFPPFHVQEAIPSKQGETRKDLIQIIKQKPSLRKNVILSNWVFEKASPWNDKWERTFTINTGRGTVEMRQRIIQLTPWHAYFMGVEYDMDQMFLTKELGPEFVLSLLYKHYGNQKDMKEIDKRLQIARFMQQAEWYGVALKELEQLVKEHSEAKTSAEPIIEQLKRLRASLFAEDIERTHKIGQHEEAQNRIAAFFQENLGKDADPKQKIVVQDLKTKYETSKERMQQAKQFLKELPARLSTTDRPFWTIAAATIVEELTIDTLPRLETFLSFAQQHQRELTEKGKTAQPTEEILAIAVSGWLQGNNLAEPDVKNATKLFKARLMLQEYLKTDGSVARGQLAATFQREHELPVDVVARVVRHMPPILPYDQISDKLLALDIEVPDAAEGKYLVQLPPDYNPYRSYPVVVLLQSSRETASDMMKRWQAGAAYHGYLLAAPLWVGKARDATYKYSAKEHALVLDSLRDLRRRFHVDSDRVFLFGWEDGAAMAFDVGLSHPDQFAGVLPKNGNCEKFPIRYLTNGQYLPFYVIEGQSNGNMPKQTYEKLIKPWIKGHYPSIYVEYKGRASEWYAIEMPTMFEWMNKKKRHYPARELGRGALVAGAGDEFKTSRDFDNKFYWLGTNNIDERNITDAVNYQTSTRPATMQASIAVGNEAGGKTAKIWNQISIRTTGIKQVSIWLAPNMIDFTKPVMIRVNGAQHGNARVIPPSLPTMLEEYYQSGEKERLFYAKVDLKL